MADARSKQNKALADAAVTERFWETLSLAGMSEAQWEQLCDGCGRCCLHKLEDEETLALKYTAVACFELNLKSIRCRHYATRQQRVPDCLVLKPDMDERVFSWLPPSCAYRVLHEGRRLPDWHPLISGDVRSVRRAGISIAAFAVSELRVDEAEFEDYVIEFAPLQHEP